MIGEGLGMVQKGARTGLLSYQYAFIFFGCCVRGMRELIVVGLKSGRERTNKCASSGRDGSAVEAWTLARLNLVSKKAGTPPSTSSSLLLGRGLLNRQMLQFAGLIGRKFHDKEILRASLLRLDSLEPPLYGTG